MEQNELTIDLQKSTLLTCSNQCTNEYISTYDHSHKGNASNILHY